MSQPRIPADLAAELQRMGAHASCYQPVTLFKKDGRKLPNVPNADDPWHVVLRRNDRVIWADGSTVAQATGETLREAIMNAINKTIPPGLLPKLSGLGEAVDRLVVAIRQNRNLKSVP